MRNAGVTSHAFVVDRPEKTALRPRVTDGINNQPSAIDLDGPMRADNVRALREIRTLRSEGAGGGRLPPATRWAESRDSPLSRLTACRREGYPLFRLVLTQPATRVRFDGGNSTSPHE